MPKIAFIGAGSVVFAKQLIADILFFPELQDCTISLMDIDRERLDMISALAGKLVAQEGLPAKIESSMDRREAIDGADYVVAMIQVGGLEASTLDIEVPFKYGVDQCIGDTLGPGGVFRALRTIPIMLDICEDMEEICPDALLLNYTNPMAMVCWAVNEVSTIRNVGLCHGVQHTARLMAFLIGAPIEEVTYLAAGINHMAWFLEFRWNDEDAYPLLWKVVEKEGGYQHDKYRFEMMRHVGYFMTETSGHLSEYVPYFRKRKDLMERFGGPGFEGESKFYLRLSKAASGAHYATIEKQLAGEEPIEFGARSDEYASGIMHAMETGRPYRFNGNVPNTGLITNLPEGVCVEVPCFVDSLGIYPSSVGMLPPLCAALNMSNIAVQEMAVRAALERDRMLAFQAVMADPLTAAVLAPHEIRQMVDEMFEAELEWLPEFA